MHIRSHAASYSCCYWFHVLFLNVHPGSYFRCLQLQRQGGLSGVSVAAVPHRVAHCLKRLSFSSILIQAHLVEVFLEPWLAGVEWWGRCSRNKVGSPEDYIVSQKSKWNEWQPTCTFNSSWIRLHIAALCIAAADTNSPMVCSKSVRCCLSIYGVTLWSTTADISSSIDTNRTFFDGQEVWWCLSEDLPGILHESQANHRISMYS